MWLLGRGDEYPVHENSLESVRFAELESDPGAVDSVGRPRTRTAERPVHETSHESPETAGMTAWVISNAALDLNGDFVPPPIQLALARETEVEDLRPPRRDAQEPAGGPIRQLDFRLSPEAPAQFFGTIDDGGDGGG